LKSHEVFDRAAKTAALLRAGGVEDAQVAQLVEKYYAQKHEESIPNLKVWLVYQASRDRAPIPCHVAKVLIDDLDEFKQDPGSMRTYIQCLKMLHKAAKNIDPRVLRSVMEFKTFIEKWKEARR
jgi:hypothetical protein